MNEPDSITPEEHRRVREENVRLTEENRRLKALLESFSVQSASSLATTAPEHRTRRTPPPESAPTPSPPCFGSLPQARGPKQAVAESAERLASRKEKIDLLWSLFRGREDVYALRWESKTGKSGYSPACANEWNRPLCQKPCSKCQNAKCHPISDEAIRDHVLGKQTVGIYPLLPDETCWFLAADFDKEGWQEDVRAFLNTCRDFGLTAAVERSRSGRGGHVWIFFEEPIAGGTARKLGSAILTRAMDRRHMIGLDSQDSFFTNQDTMPKGASEPYYASAPRDDGITTASYGY